MAGIIQDDLTIQSEEPVLTEVKQYVNYVEHTTDGPTATLDDLSPEFRIDLYRHTSVRKVEPVSKPYPPDSIRPAQL